MDQQRLGGGEKRKQGAPRIVPASGLAKVPESLASAMAGSRYVYCIIRGATPRDFGEIGIGGGTRVYTVHHGELAAVVSDTPVSVYDPTRENVLTHEFVNETVMREFTVIPMSFGTVFKSEDDVGQLLRTTYGAFMDVLEKVKDRIEFGVQVRWDRDSVVKSVERDNDEVRQLRDEIVRNSASPTYLARMRLNRLIESALDELSGRYVEAIQKELKCVSIASRSCGLIGDRMIMNTAFLVDRSCEMQFDETVRELSRRFELLLSFRYTGPWPPYNFVSIKLKLERVD